MKNKLLISNYIYTIMELLLFIVYVFFYSFFFFKFLFLILFTWFDSFCYYHEFLNLQYFEIILFFLCLYSLKNL